MTPWARFSLFMSDFGIEPTIWISILCVTAVLAIGWLIHCCAMRAHPLWRVVTWRIVLVSVLAIGLSAWYMGVRETDAKQSPLQSPDLTVRTSGRSLQPPMRFAVLQPIQDIAVGALSDPMPHGSSPFAGIAAGDGSSPDGDLEGERVLKRLHTAFDFETWMSKAFVPTWLCLAWLLGVIFLGVRLLLGRQRVKRLVQLAHPVSVELFLATREIARSIGCKRVVDIRKTAETTTPTLLGILRPTLLLPDTINDKKNFDELRPIFVHEFCHLRAQDHLWGFLARMVSVALWPHPLAWRLWSAHSAACEALCNRASAKILGDTTLFERTVARLAAAPQRNTAPEDAATDRTQATVSRHQPDALRRRSFSSPMIWCKGPRSHQCARTTL